MASFRGNRQYQRDDVNLMDNAINGSEQPVLPNGPATSPSESEYVLNIVGIFQDHVTREWATQSFRRATELAGEERIQNNWFSAGSLSDPAILVEAVQATLEADVIVVSIYADDELPLDLYVWFDAWLPRRGARAGALAAVVGVATPMQPQSLRTFDYLEAVARRARLDFIPDERLRPAASLPAVSKPGPGRIRLRPRSIPEVPDQFGDGYNHCGLHE